MIHFALKTLQRLIYPKKLSILIYHQVLAEKDPMRPSEPDISAFTWQMELIHNYFTPLSLSDALHHLEQGTLPPNAVCITFDDGYRNNLTNAVPILKQFNMPATCFVATAFTNGENMFNDLILDLVGNTQIHTLKRATLDLEQVRLDSLSVRHQIAHQIIDKVKYLPLLERTEKIAALYAENAMVLPPNSMLNNHEIQQLAIDMEIGAHTIDHPILKVLDKEEQMRQIRQSKETLEDILDDQVSLFAYPNGKPDKDFDRVTMELVEGAGFKCAVSTAWGASDKNTNRYRLNRFTPWDKTPMKFHFRLLQNLM